MLVVEQRHRHRPMRSVPGQNREPVQAKRDAIVAGAPATGPRTQAAPSAMPASERLGRVARIGSAICRPAKPQVEALLPPRKRPFGFGDGDHAVIPQGAWEYEGARRHRDAAHGRRVAARARRRARTARCHLTLRQRAGGTWRAGMRRAGMRWSHGRSTTSRRDVRGPEQPRATLLVVVCMQDASRRIQQQPREPHVADGKPHVLGIVPAALKVNPEEHAGGDRRAATRRGRGATAAAVASLSIVTMPR